MGEALRLTPRPLGRTGISVSPLVLAGGAIFGANPENLKITPEDVERAFYDHGINTFLVVPMMKPMAEGVRRLVKAEHRNEIVIVTEVSFPFGWWVRRDFERISRSLGVETIDVFLLGWVRARWHMTGNTWKTFVALRDEGKVRAIGFSCHDRVLATQLTREFPVDTLMIRYNAAHRGAEREVFDPLGDSRPAIIGYTATRWGMLLKSLPTAGFDAPMTAGECYRFALGHPSVDAVMCGARSLQEIRENVEATLNGPLDAARLAEVRKFGDAVHANARGGFRWMFRGG
ncbi:MAG: aldo/keto reductase [Deltaproteobacteria bacterium]|nr:aldo/keto reductase [Deltaproteobacteria bacterium]